MVKFPWVVGRDVGTSNNWYIKNVTCLELILFIIVKFLKLQDERLDMLWFKILFFIGLKIQNHDYFFPRFLEVLIIDSRI